MNRKLFVIAAAALSLPLPSAAPRAESVDGIASASVVRMPGAAAVLLAQAARPTEAPLRKTIQALASGTPNYDDMEPALQNTVRNQIVNLTRGLSNLSEPKTISFIGTSGKADVYGVAHADRVTLWVLRLSSSGKIEYLTYHIF